MNEGNENFGKINFGEEDPLLKDAIEAIAETQQASATLLQRKFAIGYARAANIIYTLEQKGVIGPKVGNNPRKIYIDRSVFEKKPEVTEPRFLNLNVPPQEMLQILKGETTVHIQFNSTMLSMALTPGKIISLSCKGGKRVPVRILSVTVEKIFENFSRDILKKAGLEKISASLIYDYLRRYRPSDRISDELIAIEFEPIDTIDVGGRSF